MRIALDQGSFSAGEVSPELDARRSIARVQAGVRLAENVVVTPEGNLTAAPGTRFVAAARDASRPMLLIPFDGRTGADALCVAINGGVLRFYKRSGPVVRDGGIYEIEAPADWSDASFDNLRWGQSVDVLYVCGAGRPRQINRNDDGSISITDYEYRNGPVKDRNLDKTRTLQASAVTGSVTLTAAGAALFAAGHVGSVWRIDENDLSTVPQWVGGVAVSLGDRRRNRGNVYEALNAASSGPNPPSHDEGDWSSGGGYVNWRFVDNGRGYVRITAVTSATIATATVLQRLPASVVAAGSYRWYEAAWSDKDGWPDRVLIFDQKMGWGRGDRLWITRPGDFYDFDTTGEEDSAIPIRLTPPQSGAVSTAVNIEWMLHSGILVIGTTSGEHILRGAAAADQLTISSIRAISDTGNGSARHRPVMAERGAVFIGPDNKRLYYADFERLSETIDATQLTAFARHILKPGAREIVYQREPMRVLWLRMADGSLRSLTFDLKQEIVGWARRVFVNGACEGLISLSGEGGQVDVWLVMRRVIGGRVGRYLERMEPFFIPAEDDLKHQTATGAWFVDSGLSLEGSEPVTRVSGLDHLAGEAVRVFADGADRGSAVVSVAGDIRLDREARSVTVGLPVPLRITGLSSETELSSGVTRGLRRRASKAAVTVTATAVGEISVNASAFEPLFQTGGRRLGPPMQLTHGTVLAGVVAPSARTLEWTIRRDEALPFTLLAVAPHAEFPEGP